MNSIVEKFNKMGAEVNLRVVSRTVQNSWFRIPRPPTERSPIVIDIKTEKGKEVFDIAVREDVADNLQVLECLPDERHLVLYVKGQVRDVLPPRLEGGKAVGGERVVNRDLKMHFLCGHDERHWFVAGVKACSTVREAKTSLKPLAVRQVEQRVGLKNSKSHKRHNEAWVRQGEWFFVPTPGLVVDELAVRKDEPITRSGKGGKPHTAQFAVRAGGERVWTNSKGHILSIADYKGLKPEDRIGYTSMLRNPELYVKGTVRHLDHATIDLGQEWHRVYMNSERHELRGRSVAFLD